MAVPKDWDQDSVDAEDFERVRLTLYAAVVCESIPRRLGKDADSKALARDKRTARMVANAYRSLWMSLARLGADPAPTWDSRATRLELARQASKEARRFGATVRWPEFLAERRADLETRRRLVAAFAIKAGLPKWGGRRVRMITDEIGNLDRIEERRKHGRKAGA